MKPDAATKDGIPYWYLVRIPKNEIKPVLEKHSKSQMLLPHITGLKVFEKPGKLVISVTLWNPQTKKYNYAWGASLVFKKTGVVIFTNLSYEKSIRECQKKKFCNTTYSPSRLESLIKCAYRDNVFRCDKNAKGVNFRKNSSLNKLKSIVFDKAKREGVITGKLSKKDSKKISLCDLLAMLGSEWLCNTVHFTLKKAPETTDVSLFMPSGGSHRSALLKVLKKHTSFEKIVKSIWGRGGKNLIRFINESTTYIADSKLEAPMIDINKKKITTLYM